MASLYRAFAEAEQAAAGDDLPLQPKPALIWQAGEPQTPEKPLFVSA